MRAPRRDANERDIIRVLEAHGCLVQQIHQGGGVPDLLVWSPLSKRLVLLEVKDGSKVASKRGLTPEQVDWHERWCDAPVFVVETIVEAIRAVRCS